MQLTFCNRIGRHGAMSDLSPLCAPNRTSISRDHTACCKNDYGTDNSNGEMVRGQIGKQDRLCQHRLLSSRPPTPIAPSRPRVRDMAVKPRTFRPGQWAELIGLKYKLVSFWNSGEYRGCAILGAGLYPVALAISFLGLARPSQHC